MKISAKFSTKKLFSYGSTPCVSINLGEVKVNHPVQDKTEAEKLERLYVEMHQSPMTIAFN